MGMGDITTEYYVNQIMIGKFLLARRKYAVANNLKAQFLVYKVTMLALPKTMLKTIAAVRTIKDRLLA